jgi:hypothetical protein
MADKSSMLQTISNNTTVTFIKSADMSKISYLVFYHKRIEFA